MADTYIVTVCWSPGDLMQLVRQKFALYYWRSIGAAPMTVVLAAYHGCRAIVLKDNVEFNNSFVFVIGNQKEDAIAPQSQYFNSPGFSGSWANVTNGNTAEAPATVMAVYEQFLTETWAAIVSSWTDSVDQTLNVMSDGAADDYIVTLTATLTGSATSEYGAAVDYGTFWINRNEDIPDGLAILANVLPRVAPFAIPSPAMGGGDLGRIASALEDISMRGEDISINHGASMFSVNGKVIVET